jgi:hypothetical protein
MQNSFYQIPKGVETLPSGVLKKSKNSFDKRHRFLYPNNQDRRVACVKNAIQI